jgi:hypothetical protein
MAMATKNFTIGITYQMVVSASAASFLISNPSFVELEFVTVDNDSTTPSESVDGHIVQSRNGVTRAQFASGAVCVRLANKSVPDVACRIAVDGGI